MAVAVATAVAVAVAVAMPVDAVAIATLAAGTNSTNAHECSPVDALAADVVMSLGVPLDVAATAAAAAAAVVVAAVLAVCFWGRKLQSI